MSLEGNSQPPLVTVIAVCYNHEAFAEECLEGIRSQTYQPIQLIIMDDCSTDRSVAVITRWIEKHRVDCTFIPHRSNAGLCRTLNEALALARGKYISIIATDDVWLPRKIEHQVAILEAAPEDVGVVYGDAYRIDAEGKLLGKRFIECERTLERMPEGDIYQALVERNFIPAMTTLVKAACYEKAGAYDERLVFEDWDMWLRIAHHFRFAYSRELLVKYRVLSTSLVRNLGLRGMETLLIINLKSLKSPKTAPHMAAALKRRITGLAEDLYLDGFPDCTRYLWLRLRYNPGIRTLIMFVASLLGIEYAALRRVGRFVKRLAPFSVQAK